jgi:dTDP-4-dehydrorhamnose 3,5-epimerase
MQKWTTRSFDIQGPVFFGALKRVDDRGFFTERFRADELKTLGLKENFVQDNFSHSIHKVLRGLHYQWDRPQGKLVTCVRGRIFDVAVDLRRLSPTYGQTISIILSGDEPGWFWIPAGFAHGFVTLSEDGADVWYKVNNYYNGSAEGAIRWDDPSLKIQWPVTDPIVSPKDEAAPSFTTYMSHPRF